MAKPNSEWAGNSCHLHMSLVDAQGAPVFFDDSQPRGVSSTMGHFIAGVLASMPELTAVMAPNPNSYRRYAPYSWAGTSATWGIDNRSVGLRAIVEGASGTRLEHRQAGGDVNPYLATAVMLAAGLDGIARGLEPPAPFDTDVYSLPSDSVPAVPRSLTEAVDALEGSEMAREWLGDDFVNYFVAIKRAELHAQSMAVTDWEISRYLEAL